MEQKKLELMFSTTDDEGKKASERHVRRLIAGMAELHTVDDYELNKTLTGYWQGKENDTYKLTVICHTEYEYHKTRSFFKVLSNVIKWTYVQHETLLTETIVTI